MTSPPNIEHLRVTTERARYRSAARRGDGRPIFPPLIPLIMERHPVGCEVPGRQMRLGNVVTSICYEDFFSGLVRASDTRHWYTIA
jgi:hypothetical protein